MRAVRLLRPPLPLSCKSNRLSSSRVLHAVRTENLTRLERYVVERSPREEGIFLRRRIRASHAARTWTRASSASSSGCLTAPCTTAPSTWTAHGCPVSSSPLTCCSTPSCASASWLRMTCSPSMGQSHQQRRVRPGDRPCGRAPSDGAVEAGPRPNTSAWRCRTTESASRRKCSPASSSSASPPERRGDTASVCTPVRSRPRR
jgi:hypothetical protein